MRKIVFLFFTTFFFFFAKSQIQFGIRVGASINNQTGFQNSNTKSLLSEQASFFGIICIDKSFFLQSSIGYYSKGSRLANLTFEDQSGNPIGTGTLSLRFDYIELALPFQYLIANSKNKLFLGFGPYFSYAIGGNEIWKNISGTPSNEPTKRNIQFGNNGYKRFDVGVVGLFSAQIQNKWIVSVNYEVGFPNIYYSAQNKIHNRSGGITIGYLLN